MNFEALLEPIYNRLRLIVGRCAIMATKYNSGDLEADIELIAGEKRRNVEFLQQFGFCSRPSGNVSGVAIFVGGNRDNGVVVATNGDDLRPDLQPGEVLVHSPHGQKILLKNDGSIEMEAAAGKSIVCKSDFECQKEVYANAVTPASRVSLSKHIHPTAVGPTSSPTPGV